MSRGGDWWARGGSAALVVLALCLVVRRACFAPEGILIFQDDEAPWIMAATPVSAMLQQWGREDAPVTSFHLAFELSEAPESAALTLRALGHAALFVNGESVGLPPALSVRPEKTSAGAPPAAWKTPIRAELGSGLRAGPNRLRVDVTHARGPALLSARLEAGGLELATGRSWGVSIDGERQGPAALADDRRRHPDASRGPSPVEAADSRWVGIGALGLLGLVLYRLRRRVPLPPKRFPALALGIVTLGWLWLFASKFVHIEIVTGFDAIHHLAYLDQILEGRIPLATEGWSMYHPPLFYLASGASSVLAELLGAPSRHPLPLKLLPFLAGLGNVWIALALVRRLLPETPAASAWAALFAGLLPMNLYLAAYYSNEGLHAFLSGCALLSAVSLLLSGRVTLGRAALLSALLGLALLTKFTALVIAGLALFFVGCQTVLGHRRRPVELALRFAALCVPLLLIASWFYLRNIAEFGRPLVGNWSLPGPGQTWWSEPGFHTPAYYLSFGESLVRPYFSGFLSFWDGIYSTLWGDGFLGGRALVMARHEHWNYDYMSAGYLLALPATLLLAVGAGHVGRLALVDPLPRRRAAFALMLLFPGALAFAVFYVTLALPYAGQAKAFYALAASPALALCFALGLCRLDGLLCQKGWGVARATLWAWLAAFFGVLYLAYAA